MSALGDWLDERTGWRALTRHLLDEPVPGGARWAYVFGSVLAFLFVEQVVTGLLLASYYSPSTSAAWASVAYLQDQVRGGWIVRGLHAAGASAMVILLGLHLLQVAVWGAYRKPREVNWIVGVLMLGTTMGFALTGYLLPWDQRGYWATQVATSLLGATPLLGKPLQTLMQGGDAYGNLTLTRFYALHVFLLPATLVLLTVGHVALFRRHGVTPGWRASAAELERRTGRFWPDQLVRDLVAIAVTLALMAWSVLGSHGASLEAPADPSAAYDARPEWYFLPLFQLLKSFPGKAEVPAALGAPVLVLALLLLLPFADRGPSRAPGRRLPFIGVVLAVLAGAVWLGISARRADADSPAYQAQRKRADEQAARARRLALAGVPAAGGLAVYENDPVFVAQRLFATHCASCHLRAGVGEKLGVHLDGWASPAYIRALIQDPDAERFFGKTGVSGMKPVRASDEELDAIVEHLAGLSGAPAASPEVAARRERGKALFASRDCDACHETDGSTGGQAPNLGGWGTEAWVADFLRDPGAPRFYGKKNKMPSFGGKLSPSEITSLARLVAGGWPAP